LVVLVLVLLLLRRRLLLLLRLPPLVDLHPSPVLRSATC
jgi:hypothetical protein